MKRFTAEEFRAMHGDDKIERVVEIRDLIRQRNPVHVAKSIGRNIQCVKNFTAGKTTIPWPETIAAMSEMIATKDKKLGATVTMSADRLARIRARTQGRGRKTRFVRPLRKSVIRQSA